jgi:hypothetical protein
MFCFVEMKKSHFLNGANVGTSALILKRRLRVRKKEDEIACDFGSKTR